MVIIIQAFSDEYHLQTLSQLLETLGQLEQDVKVHSILNSLIVRLSLFCSGSSGYLPTDISLFDLFKEKIIEISKSHPKVTLEGILEMSNSLMLFCLKCYKGKLDYIDNIYDYVQDRVKEKDPNGAATEALNQIVNLLKSPLEHFEDIKIIFKLENYNKVVGILPFKQKRQVALNIVENMVKNATVINIEEDVDRLFNYLAPLVKNLMKAHKITN
jgi:vacuolar protein sorting-associated protein 35